MREFTRFINHPYKFINLHKSKESFKLHVTNENLVFPIKKKSLNKWHNDKRYEAAQNQQLTRDMTQSVRRRLFSP